MAFANERVALTETEVLIDLMEHAAIDSAIRVGQSFFTDVADHIWDLIRRARDAIDVDPAMRPVESPLAAADVQLRGGGIRCGRADECGGLGQALAPASDEHVRRD